MKAERSDWETYEISISPQKFENHRRPLLSSQISTLNFVTFNFKYFKRFRFFFTFFSILRSSSLFSSICLHFHWFVLGYLSSKTIHHASVYSSSPKHANLGCRLQNSAGDLKSAGRALGRKWPRKKWFLADSDFKPRRAFEITGAPFSLSAIEAGPAGAGALKMESRRKLKRRAEGLGRLCDKGQEEFFLFENQQGEHPPTTGAIHNCDHAAAAVASLSSDSLG